MQQISSPVEVKTPQNKSLKGKIIQSQTHKFSPDTIKSKENRACGRRAKLTPLKDVKTGLYTVRSPSNKENIRKSQTKSYQSHGEESGSHYELPRTLNQDQFLSFPIDHELVQTNCLQNSVGLANEAIPCDYEDKNHLSSELSLRKNPHNLHNNMNSFNSSKVISSLRGADQINEEDDIEPIQVTLDLSAYLMGSKTDYDQGHINRIVSENFERNFTNPQPSDQTCVPGEEVERMYSLQPELKPVLNPSMQRDFQSYKSRGSPFQINLCTQNDTVRDANSLLSSNSTKLSSQYFPSKPNLEAQLETYDLSVIEGCPFENIENISKGNIF